MKVMRFSTKIATIACTLLMVTILIVRDRLEGLPLWDQPYSQQSFDEARAEKRPVLLFFFAKWTWQTYQPYSMVRQSKVLKAACYTDDVCVMHLDGTTNTPEVQRLQIALGVRTFPAALVFCGNSDTPAVFTDLFSDEQIVQALDACKLESH